MGIPHYSFLSSCFDMHGPRHNGTFQDASLFNSCILKEGLVLFARHLYWTKGFKYQMICYWIENLMFAYIHKRCFFLISPKPNIKFPQHVCFDWLSKIDRIKKNWNVFCTLLKRRKQFLLSADPYAFNVYSRLTYIVSSINAISTSL